MTIQELLREKRGEILRIAARHGVQEIRVFGSAGRGESGPDSDVDFLIQVQGPTTPWFPGGLKVELERLLDRRVDVVESEALRAEIREEVLREARPL